MNLSEQVARLERERDELRRHLGKVMSERDFFKVDRDALLHDRDSLIHDREMAEAELAKVQAERDALQARIDAGVRVYARPHSLNSGLIIETVPGQGAQPCLLIDVETIAQVDDDRVGKADRRENPFGCDIARSDGTKGMRDYKDADSTETVKAARSNCRRKTPGTKADRRTWTRADGSTNPRVGERRGVSNGSCFRLNQTAKTVGKIRSAFNLNDRRKA